MPQIGLAWLPCDLFDWSNFYLQDDFIALLHLHLPGFKAFFCNWKEVESVSREYIKAGELEDHLQTSAPNTRPASLNRMRKIVYRHFALQVLRYTCSPVTVDYKVENELREEYQGLRFNIIHKLNGEPPYLSYSHKGPHDLGYAYYNRVHGLFDWDDGLPCTFQDYCYYRQLA